MALHASVSGGRRIRESNHAAAEGEEALGPPPPPLAPLSAIANAALHPSLSAILFCLLRASILIDWKPAARESTSTESELEEGE